MNSHSFMRIATGALALMAAGPALAQEVGKASAVNPAATANLRTITIGSSIAHKERIKTAAEGSVQILFVDKTSMTIGPNSDLTIDEYVYDPNAGSGKLAATLGKGALRFVGGQISHSGDAEIKTASAVIGIRGGVVMMSTDQVVAGYGQISVTNPAGSVSLNAGEYTQLLVTGGTQPPTPPSVAPPGVVAGLLQGFQSSGGQTGGAPRGAVSPTTVQRAESRATGANGGAVTGQLTPPVVTQLPTPVVSQGNNLTQTVQTTTQATVVRTIVDNTPPTSLSGFVGGLMVSSLGQDSGISALVGIANLMLNPQTGRVQANFDGGIYTEHEGSYAPSRFSYQYGSQDTSLDPQSAYVDSKTFAASAAVGRNGQPLSTIDGKPITNHVGVMQTVTAAQAQQYVPGTTNCDCDYTRWGFWSSSSQQNVDGRVYTDQVGGLWVAGQTINASDVPTVGTASYAGHVVANVQNGAHTYLAGGSLLTTVDFARRSGSATVSNFDGMNYRGALQITPSDPRNIYAGLYSSNESRLMILSGQFYRGSTSPVGEMGGAAIVSGVNYLGSGIFAARMK